MQRDMGLIRKSMRNASASSLDRSRPLVQPPTPEAMLPREKARYRGQPKPTAKSVASAKL